MVKVYVKLDSNKVVTDINSSIFLTDPTGWTLIDEGEGDTYAHAMSQYLPKGLTDEFGFYNYKYENALIEITEKVSNETAVVYIPHREVELGTNWTYDSATQNYRQDVAVEHMTEDDIVICDVVTKGTHSQMLAQENAWMNVNAFETGNGKITFIADLPTVIKITVLIRGV